MDFYKYLSSLVKQIPSGFVSTYTHLAIALGDKRAIGAIRDILDALYTTTIPWHRVINDNGQITADRKKQERQKHLIKKENIDIFGTVVQDYKKALFKQFNTTYPLIQLRKKQLSLQPCIMIKDAFSNQKIIGGVDVSYRDREAYAAYVAIDYYTHDILHTQTTHMKVNFPYIPTYLAYRELPVIKKLMKDFLPSILLINGHGISHPYHIGFASHLGIKFNVPTIGVAKNLLCGQVPATQTKQGIAPLLYQEKMVGWALWPPGAHKPIFVSPGHKVSLSTSLEITKKMCQYRIPEPLRIAHKMARKKMMNM